MKHPFKLGQWVQSFFRATWKGQVMEGPDKGNCYVVRVLIDRHNNPMRKPVLKHLHAHWLKSLDNP